MDGTRTLRHRRSRGHLGWAVGGVALTGFALVWWIVAPGSQGPLETNRDAREGGTSPSAPAVVGGSEEHKQRIIPTAAAAVVSAALPETLSDGDEQEAEPRAGAYRPQPRTLEEGLRRAQEREELHTRWESQRIRDGVWSRSIAERLHREFKDRTLTYPTGVDTDCRETICRVALMSNTDAEEEIMGLIRVARSLHVETWLMAEKQPDNIYEIEIFLPLDGYNLSAGGGRI